MWYAYQTMDISKQSSLSTDGYSQVTLDRDLLEKTGVLTILNETFFNPNHMRLYFDMDSSGKPTFKLMYMVDINDATWGYTPEVSFAALESWKEFLQALRG